ncbi:unnamed protein product [Rhodiola kirilowii]
MDSSSSSHYVKTVVLREWWLVRSPKEFEGKTVAVSGLPVEERAVRLFTSAPVVKRHSVFTLETSDGVFVILKGFINKPRTEEGGFSPEVFKNFLYGFPLNWEEYTGRKLDDDECPSPVLSPKKTTRNGCAATVVLTTASCYVPAEEATDAVKATPTAKFFKGICKSTGNEMVTASGVKDVRTKVSVSVQEGLESPSNLFSEISGLKKSRSGRLLLRPLEFWRNEKAVYDSSRQITGIVIGSGTPDCGEASGTIKKKKRKREGGQV